MIHPLSNAWRARHVLLVGPSGRPCAIMQALLEALGAKCARISPAESTESICRAMQAGRISAVIAPEMRALSAAVSPSSQLDALLSLLGECREAGVPLTLFLSDASVYRAAACPWHAREDDPIGGESRDGLVQSILQLCADGISRGLMGDAVSVILARHLPLLGCGHPAVSAYSLWCGALDAGQRLTVPDPGRQGLFLSPFDAYYGALLLGARFLEGDRACTGVYNLAADTKNILPNRSAALRFSAAHGGKRPILETHPPAQPPIPQLDGTKARRLCGAQPVIAAEEALGMLFALERAAKRSPEDELIEIRRQADAYLSRIL